MAFQKDKYLIRVQGGREYLPVSARLIWFREEHPDWGITTTPVEINLEKQYAIFSASIFNAEGKLMATATKMENVKGFPDYIEKAETGSVGRALAFCGYGTQFAPELEESTRLADAPYPMGGGNRFAGAGANRMAAPAQRPGGFANGGSRPLPARAPEQARPAEEDEPDFGDTDAPRADTAPAVPRPSAVAERPAPAPPPRVEDDDDPFAEMDEPAPRAPAAPPARAGQPANARSAAAAATNEAGEPVLSSNQCSEEGCTVTLTPGQVSMSQAKFGRALCPRHQRDATPLAGGQAAPRRGNAGKPEMADTLL